MRFKDYHKQQMDERAAAPSSPGRSNVAYELGLSKAIGTLAGNKLQGRSHIIQRMSPVVSMAFRKLRQEGLPRQDIEEILLDSLRLALVYTDDEGDIRGYKSTMGMGELLNRRKRRPDKTVQPDEVDQEEPEADPDPSLP